jgi:hypothetical protein
MLPILLVGNGVLGEGLIGELEREPLRQLPLSLPDLATSR